MSQSEISKTTAADAQTEQTKGRQTPSSSPTVPISPPNGEFTRPQ